MMAGVSADEIDFADAREIAEWMAWSGRIPNASSWVEGIAKKVANDQTVATLTGFFN